MPDDGFDKPFRNNILTTDFLMTPFLRCADVAHLAYCTHFSTSPFFDGFVSLFWPKPPNDGFDKPFRNNVLTTDFVSPFLKKFFMVGMAYLDNNKLKSIEKKR